MSRRPDEHEAYFSHWADHAARQALAAAREAGLLEGDPPEITVAAGITPSGVVHIGNFREVITVDLVARSLRDHGVNVRFIYSWDDFDVFRKVPVDMPEQAMLEENLRRSVADVPDPFGCHDSYASHHIAQFENSLDPLGIAPSFIRQSKRYRAGAYAQGIRRALEMRETIRGVLDQYRSEPLAADWLPLSGFCASCGRDEIDLAWDGEWSVDVHCRRCAHDATVDLRQGDDIKLPWRVDWPMRWREERVLFEPGGKDHSSAGGSYDTASQIVGPVYDWRAPQYVPYDFVRIKGRGGKISSSAGEAVTVADCLEIYEPEMLRWIFASQRPNSEFQISFDLDVIKLYEDWDRAWRTAATPDDGGKNDKKRRVVRRTLELATVDGRKIEAGMTLPFVPSFRPLSMTLQIFDGDLERTRRFYEDSGEIRTDEERRLFDVRARCVWSWIERYAPDDFRYRIRTEPSEKTLDGEPREVLQRLVDILEAHPGIDEASLIPHLKTLCEGTSMTPQAFYPYAYELLIAREKGPKLTTLLTTMGIDRALPLLKAGVA